MEPTVTGPAILNVPPVSVIKRAEPPEAVSVNCTAPLTVCTVAFPAVLWPSNPRKKLLVIMAFPAVALLTKTRLP